MLGRGYKYSLLKSFRILFLFYKIRVVGRDLGICEESGFSGGMLEELGFGVFSWSFFYWCKWLS